MRISCLAKLTVDSYFHILVGFIEGINKTFKFFFRFDVSNTDHVMQVNIGDRVSLLCPRPGVEYEYSNIYAVSQISAFFLVFSIFVNNIMVSPSNNACCL